MASMTRPFVGIFTDAVKGESPDIGKHTGLRDAARRAYSATMDSVASIAATKALWGRMRVRLDKLGLTVNSAEIKAKSKDAIRNVKRAAEKGTAYSPRAVTLDAIAIVMKTSPEWLLHGKGPEDIEDAEIARAALRLVGSTPKNEQATRNQEHSEAPSEAIREIEIHAGMGAGGVPGSQMAQIIGDESYGADAVRGYWVFPEHALRAMGLNPRYADVVPGKGDSMEPDICNGDWCVIDRRHRAPSPDGIYALWDGFSVVFKALQLIPNSDPIMVRIISKNAAYETYERALEEITIIGRVVTLIRSI